MKVYHVLFVAESVERDSYFFECQKTLGNGCSTNSKTIEVCTYH